MNLMLALVAPLALLFPSIVPEGSMDRSHLTPPEDRPPAGSEVSEWLPLAPPTQIPAFDQVRIEQRVIIRISPRGNSVRPSAFNGMDMPPPPPRLVERKMGNCIPVNKIVGVEPRGDDRLLLFLSDRTLVTAQLARNCSARDYYAGFYLERTRDGQMCVNRDKIHSRAGSNCSISSLRRLVEVGN
jgi:hypothetical protein